MTAADAQSRVRFHILALVFVAAVLCYVHRICLSTLVPAMASDLHLSDLQIGYAFGTFGLTYLLFEVPAGWVSDRWGQRFTMTRIGAGWSILTIATGLAWNFWSLVGARAGFGATEAGCFPALSSGLARWFPTGERSGANGFMWMGSRLGGAAAPFIAVMLSRWAGWRWALISLGALGFVWCIPFQWYYRDDPADHPSVSAAELAIIRSGLGPAPESKQGIPLTKLLFSGNMMAVFFMYFASAYGFQFFVTWLPTYFMREHLLTLSQSAAYAALPLAAGAVGCLVGGVFSDWLVRCTGSVVWGRRSIALGGFTLAACGFLTACFAHTSGQTITCLAISAGAQDITVPVAWATCVDIGGRHGGTASGFANTASSLAAVVSPVSAAWLLSKFGSFQAMFMVAAMIYLIGGLLWLRIDPTRREQV